MEGEGVPYLRQLVEEVRVAGLHLVPAQMVMGLDRETVASLLMQSYSVGKMGWVCIAQDDLLGFRSLLASGSSVYVLT